MANLFELNWSNFLRFRGKIEDSDLALLLIFILSFNFKRSDLFSELQKSLRQEKADPNLFLEECIARFCNEEDIDQEIHERVQEILRKKGTELLYFVRDWEFLFLTESLFGEAFDYFFERINIQAGKFGAFATPRFLRSLIKELISKGAYSAFDPACGSGSLLSDFLSIGGQKVYGQDIDPNTLIFAKLRFIGKPSVKLYQGNSLTSDILKGQKTDLVISNPPFNIRVEREDLVPMNFFFGEGMINSKVINLAWVKLGLHHLREDGLGIFILPNSSMYSLPENDIRKYLVETGQVQAIIGLPGNLLIYSGVSVCIWVVNKRQSSVKRDILFIDASNYKVGTHDDNFFSEVGAAVDFFRNGRLVEKAENFDFISVSQEQIREQEYFLNPNRYLFEYSDDIGDLSKYDKLGSVLSRPIFVSTEGLNEVVKKISVQNLNGTLSNVAISTDELNEGGRRAVFIHSDQPILLFARVGKRLKPTLLSNHHSLAFDFVNVFFYSVDTSKVLIEYLIIELEKPYVVSQLDRLQSGSTIPSLRKKDLEDLRVFIPSIEEQKRLIDEEKQRLVKVAEEELKVLAQKIGFERADANSFLRHKIAGPLKNLRGAFSNINLMLEKHVLSQFPEILEKKVNEKRTKTFKDYLEIFERDLEKVMKLINQSSDEYAIESKSLEEVDLISFIKNYLEEKEGSEKGVSFKLFIDKDVLDEAEAAEIVLLSNVELLGDLLDNLVRNAVMHGFRDFDGKKEIQFSISPVLERNLLQVHVNVSNSGNPVGSSFTIELFSKQGAKAGNSEGDGFGLWYVKEIMKKHKGELRFIDESKRQNENNLVSTFQLIFPIKDLKKNNVEV